MAVTIGTTTSNSGTWLPGQHKVWQTNDGSYIAVYYDGTNFVWQSCPAGSDPQTAGNWTAKSTINSGSITSGQIDTLMYDTSGGTLHVLYKDSSHFPTYRQLTYSSSTHTWSLNGSSTTVASVDTGGTAGEALRILWDGTRVWCVTHRFNSGAFWDAYYTTTPLTATWTASKTLTSVSNNGNEPIDFCVVGQRYIFVFAAQASNNGQWWYCDTQTSLTTWTTASVSNGSLTNAWDDRQVSCNGSGSYAFISWYKPGTAAVLPAYKWDPASPSSLTALTSLDGSSTSDASVSFTYNGTDLYAVWERASDSYVVYGKFDGSSGWGTITRLSSVATSSANNEGVGSGSSSASLMTLWLEGAASPYNIRFDRVALASNPATQTDSGALTDSANQIGINGPSDSGSASESQGIGTGSTDSATVAEQNAIALLNADAATFAEQVAITVTAATSDSATLTDSASANAGQVSKSDTDTAALAEQIKLALTATDSAQLGESMAIALAHQDTAQLQELVSVAIAIADAASLSEGQSVTAHTSTSDSATLTGESGSVSQTGNSPSSSDSGTLGETSSSTAAVSQTDIGSLAEQAAIRLGATDLASLTEQIGLGLIAADNSALTEQLQVAVANAQTDSGSLAELQNIVTAILQVTDAAALGESATVQVFSGGQRDWVFVISAPTTKWSSSAPSAKWAATAPQQ